MLADCKSGNSSYVLCICSQVPGMANAVKEMVGTELFSNIFLSDSDPAVELKPAVDSGCKIVLLIMGRPGRDAIQYVCNDYKKPVNERRTKWVHCASAGVDSFHLETLKREMEGVMFTNGRGAFGSVLAEHVMFSMLYFYRQTWRLQASRAKHVWDAFNMVELRGKTMGIIGYGDIGQATAKLATAFDMEVTGVKRFAPAQAVDKYGVRLVNGDEERDRVIRESDFVVNILPGTEETKNFFNKERFAMMKPTAVYISIGRGLTQNEDDLAHALQTGVIRAAAVDVFLKEPLPKESPLWEIGDDKLLFTSHNAFKSENTFSNAADTFVNIARDFISGRPITCYKPNIEAGY